MAMLEKVRIQLLDQTTGSVLKEVDVLTSAHCVTFDDGQTFQEKLDAGLLKGATGENGKPVELRKTATSIEWRYVDTSQGVDANWVTLCPLADIKGDKGDTGATGVEGKSAYQIYVDNLAVGDVQLTETEWIASLKGATGTQGIQGIKGDKGDPFTIAKTYTSITAMNADFSNASILEGSFVLIDTGNVDDADNAKLYVKGSASFTFITDLSGAQGIKGEKGDKGDAGDTVKIGTDLATAIEAKLFFKLM